jgi:hypothetical protein
MLFISSFDSGMYTVDPTYYELSGPHRNKVQGLHANFRNHMFDSADAQKQERWTDEQRERVETYLLEHEDFVKSGETIVMPELRAAIRLADDVLTEPQEKVAGQRCLFTVPVDGGMLDVCGAAVETEGEMYCDKHLKEIEDAPTVSRVTQEV